MKEVKKQIRFDTHRKLAFWIVCLEGVFALLLGTKVFGQEWQWNYIQNERTYSGFMETHELSDGRIIATGAFHDKNVCGNYVFQHPVLLKLDSDGTELAFSEYYKDGYFGYAPLVLENESGEVYALMAFSPDHDTCSLNYFMNYEPITDHCILGLFLSHDILNFKIAVIGLEGRATEAGCAFEEKCEHDDDEASDENGDIDVADATPTLEPYLTAPSEGLHGTPESM